MTASPPIAGRLPETVTPDLYTITLTVDPETPPFSGRVTIDITLRAPTKTITLHALELTIQRAEIEANSKTLDAKVEEEKSAETITLACSDTLPIGRATITIEFTGTLNKQLRGLYEAHATVDGREEKFAFTQCEATDARRIFPCFDEPGLKARVRLTAVVPARLTALSNMPIESDTVDGAVRRVRFQETPVMSTYLFALAVARFEEKSLMVDGCRLAVVTLPGQLRYADFALEVGAAGLSLLNNYFGLRYPLTKLDLVGLPDFAMGAMENWGAIFFRDSRLLVDDQLASTGTKRIVANVIVHEIVHQWFGNLVTMWWWDDLWLNEAFATWLAVKIVDQWRPEWNSWVEFQQEKQIPFSVDALESTRPISSKVTSAAQIEELFDALTYEKGAAVLRMIEQFLGETAFRDGIRRYIAAHQYGNAPAADLWAALEAASGQPVPAIAHDWFTQPGFPLITLHKKDDRTFSVTQQRFHAVEQVESTRSTTRWTVPVILKFHDEYGVHTHPFLLREAAAVVTLPGTGPIQWILANSGESGFFRTHYDPALRAAVRTIAATQLEPAERIGLLDHLRALSQAGTLPIDEWMDCLVRFQGDRTRVVVQALADQLELLSNQFITADDHSLMAGLAMELFDPLWQHFGWGNHPSTQENDEARLARAASLWALGRIAQPSSLLREAADRFERYLADPASLDPTLATPVVRLHAGFGDAKQFDRYIELFTHAQTPEERDRYLLALADFPDPALARRYLDFSLSDAVRSQDAWKPMRFLLAHPAHPAVQTEAWAFMQSRWDRLREKTGSVGAMRMIQGLRHVWRPDWHDDVRRFFDDPAHRVPSAERALAQTLEFIRIGIAFKERQQTALSNWLKKHGPGRGR